MTPHMLVDTDRGDLVEPVRVINQSMSALRDDRAVRGVPRHTETGRGTGDGQTNNYHDTQRPVEPNCDEPVT